MKLSEADMAILVIRHLEGWEIYQEVQVHTGGRRADIVAVIGQIVHVVEVKQSLSLSLLNQARGWIQRAHFVSVAVPWPANRSRSGGATHEYLRWKGIGCLWVGRQSVQADLPPRLNRKASTSPLRAALNERQKTFAPAGNAESRYWTPFQETRRRIEDKVSAVPGITLKELMDGLDHHYRSEATARTAIPHWIRAGVMGRVEIRRDGRLLRLYPKEVDANV